MIDISVICHGMSRIRWWVSKHSRIKYGKRTKEILNIVLIIWILIGSCCQVNLLSIFVVRQEIKAMARRRLWRSLKGNLIYWMINLWKLGPKTIKAMRTSSGKAVVESSPKVIRKCWQDGHQKIIWTTNKRLGPGPRKQNIWMKPIISTI